MKLMAWLNLEWAAQQETGEVVSPSTSSHPDSLDLFTKGRNRYIKMLNDKRSRTRTSRLTKFETLLHCFNASTWQHTATVTWLPTFIHFWYSDTRISPNVRLMTSTVLHAHRPTTHIETANLIELQNAPAKVMLICRWVQQRLTLQYRPRHPFHCLVIFWSCS
jgi:hypothetical protein